MLTEDPVKMMKNLYAIADENCLLGVTVWGSQETSNLLTIMGEAMAANQMPIPNERPHSYLSGKLGWLGEQSGWQLILEW